MMKTKTIINSLLILLLFLGSCVNGETWVTTQQSENKWLQDLACEFPCWQDVTPQKTEFDEVMSTLGEAKLAIAFTSRTESEISFQFQSNIAGTIQRASNGTVNDIILGVRSENITLDDIVQLIDQPEKVHFGKNLYDGSKCSVSIVFQTRGVILDLFPIVNRSGNISEGRDCLIDIDKNSQVFRIVLIGDIDNSEYWKNTPYSELDYVDWRGFGTYP
jgi:hypothetical protein